MMLDLVGGKMKPSPDWALSVAELERLGLDERSAKLAAGVSPSFDLSGRWVVLTGDQEYDPATAWLITIDGDVAKCSRGRRTTLERWRRFALLRFPTSHPSWIEESLVLSSAPAEDRIYGMLYSGSSLPAGDPGRLWDASDAEDLPMAEAVSLCREEALWD